MRDATEIEAIEKRARAARVHMKDVCGEAGIRPSSWSRAKKRKAASVETLRALESALDTIEHCNANARSVA